MNSEDRKEAWEFGLMVSLRGLVAFLLLAGSGPGCQPPESRLDDSYLRQQAAAEQRAAAFKEAGRWTPAAMRAFSRSLKSGAVVPERALAEMGIVALEDVNLSTVRAAVDSVAARVERGERP